MNKKLFQNIVSNLIEALNNDEPYLSSHYFTLISQTDEDVLVTDEDGNEFELSCDTTDREILHDELEEQMDLVVAPELCEYEITGTEIVGFQYDEETCEGSFEFNIFYTIGIDESLNEAVERYLSVEPIEGGFIPNTDIEYTAQVVLYEGDKPVDSIMFPFDDQTDKEIRELAKDHFPNITDDISVIWY